MGIVTLNIVGCGIFIYCTRKTEATHIDPSDNSQDDFDGIKELNNPLPVWWLWSFWLTIIYSVGYLYVYPGFGDFEGIFGWSSTKQLQEEINVANKELEPLYAKFAAKSIKELAIDSTAMQTGKRLFIGNCALCHGSDAKGHIGFPDLTNNKWIYGGTPEEIKATIAYGRQAFMPPMGEIIGGEEGIEAVAAYVLSLNDGEQDPVLVKKGEEKYRMVCIACHGEDGKGNKLLGAADLTDPEWIYGPTLNSLYETIRNGRSGVMPAFHEILSEAQINLLTAYVYSLSHN